MAFIYTGRTREHEVVARFSGPGMRSKMTAHLVYDYDNYPDKLVVVDSEGIFLAGQGWVRAFGVYVEITDNNTFPVAKVKYSHAFYDVAVGQRNRTVILPEQLSFEITFTVPVKEAFDTFAREYVEVIDGIFTVDIEGTTLEFEPYGIGNPSDKPIALAKGPVTTRENLEPTAWRNDYTIASALTKLTYGNFNPTVPTDPDCDKPIWEYEAVGDVMWFLTWNGEDVPYPTRQWIYAHEASGLSIYQTSPGEHRLAVAAENYPFYEDGCPRPPSIHQYGQLTFQSGFFGTNMNGWTMQARLPEEVELTISSFHGDKKRDTRPIGDRNNHAYRFRAWPEGLQDVEHDATVPYTKEWLVDGFVDQPNVNAYASDWPGDQYRYPNWNIVNTVWKFTGDDSSDEDDENAGYWYVDGFIPVFGTVTISFGARALPPIEIISVQNKTTGALLNSSQYDYPGAFGVGSITIHDGVGSTGDRIEVFFKYNRDNPYGPVQGIEGAGDVDNPERLGWYPMIFAQGPLVGYLKIRLKPGVPSQWLSMDHLISPVVDADVIIPSPEPIVWLHDTNGVFTNITGTSTLNTSIAAYVAYLNANHGAILEAATEGFGSWTAANSFLYDVAPFKGTGGYPAHSTSDTNWALRLSEEYTLIPIRLRPSTDGFGMVYPGWGDGTSYDPKNRLLAFIRTLRYGNTFGGTIDPTTDECPPGTTYDPVLKRCLFPTRSVYNMSGVRGKYRASYTNEEGLYIQKALMEEPPIVSDEFAADGDGGGEIKEFRFIYGAESYFGVATVGDESSSVVRLYESHDECDSWEDGVVMPLFEADSKHPDILYIKSTKLLAFAAYRPDAPDAHTGTIVGRLQYEGDPAPRAEFVFQLYNPDTLATAPLKVFDDSFKLTYADNFLNSIVLICLSEDGEALHLTSEDDLATWEVIPTA